MKREDKNIIIDQLTDRLNAAKAIYITDIADLNAEDTSNLRRMCYAKDIELTVVKNALLKQAFMKSNLDVEELYKVLNGPTSLMICDVANGPANLIKDFRRKKAKPIIKGAYVEESIYIGDNQLEALTNIKSKNELIADLVYQLKSPMLKVVSGLQSGSNIITGVLKTLANKNEN